jgi:membrane protein involved in colicin uptake
MQSSMFGLTKSKTVVAIAVTVILGLGLSNAVISSSAACNTRVAAGGNGSAWILILHKV